MHFTIYTYNTLIYSKEKINQPNSYLLHKTTTYHTIRVIPNTNDFFKTFIKCYSTLRKEKYLFRKTYTNLNVAGPELAAAGNRPGALTTKPYVLIELRRNFYTLFTTYVCCLVLVRIKYRIGVKEIL